MKYLGIFRQNIPLTKINFNPFGLEQRDVIKNGRYELMFIDDSYRIYSDDVNDFIPFQIAAQKNWEKQ